MTVPFNRMREAVKLGVIKADTAIRQIEIEMYRTESEKRYEYLERILEEITLDKFKFNV